MISSASFEAAVADIFLLLTVLILIVNLSGMTIRSFHFNMSISVLITVNI